MFDFDLTLPFMAIQFLVLMVVLERLFYKPLGNAIDERAQYVTQTHQSARERLEKAKSLAEQYQQELVNVRREAQTVVVQAQDAAQQTVAAEVKVAQQQVQQERAAAAQAIETQKSEAFATLQGEVEGLSHQILAKLLGPELV
ncbi:MAG: F0F1 ATP synthase subunit B' [Cyanobacteria bacterium P01_G01_bin.54]